MPERHRLVRSAHRLARGALVLSAMLLADAALFLLPVVRLWLGFLLALAPLAALGLGIALAWTRTIPGPERFRAAGALLVLAALPFAVLPTAYRLDRRALDRAAARGEPVVAAIERYDHDHGAPPPSLDALVPRYLAALPWTGLVLERSFRYQLAPTGCPTPWELYVATATPFDEFFYWPVQPYPRTRPGGTIEPRGRWAYFHE